MAAADRACARKIEDLVLRIGNIADPEIRECANQLMGAVLELHGAALERVVEIVALDSPTLVRKLAGDELVSALLILHDLHPDDLETRVRRALLKWHGSAELVGAFDGVVRVRLSGGGCGLKEAVESAIREAAPDAVEIVLTESLGQSDFVPVSALGFSIAGGD